MFEYLYNETSGDLALINSGDESALAAFVSAGFEEITEDAYMELTASDSPAPVVDESEKLETLTAEHVEAVEEFLEEDIVEV